MAVLIELSGRRDAQELMARLDVAFRHWGGVGYYVTPPRRPMKRWLAQAVLIPGGLLAVKTLLAGSSRLKDGSGDIGRFQAPVSDGDREDVAVLRTALQR